MRRSEHEQKDTFEVVYIVYNYKITLPVMGLRQKVHRYPRTPFSAHLGRSPVRVLWCSLSLPWVTRDAGRT
jgi:hypothetical protein